MRKRNDTGSSSPTTQGASRRSSGMQGTTAAESRAGPFATSAAGWAMAGWRHHARPPRRPVRTSARHSRPVRLRAQSAGDCWPRNREDARQSACRSQAAGPPGAVRKLEGKSDQRVVNRGQLRTEFLGNLGGHPRLLWRRAKTGLPGETFTLRFAFLACSGRVSGCCAECSATADSLDPVDWSICRVQKAGPRVAEFYGHDFKVTGSRC